MSLPNSFQYFVNRAASARRSLVKILPRGSSTVNQNSQITIDLPTDSIIDLSTLSMRAKFIYQNAVGGTAGVRTVPQTHTLFRSVQWALNNQIVSGANSGSQWGRVYEALRRCQASKEHGNSHADEYRNTPLVNGSGKFEGSFAATNSVGQNIAFGDFGGLQNCKNAANMDSALLGNISLILQLAGTEICMGYADAGTNNYDWQLQNVEFTVEVVNFVGSDNVYDQIMSEMLSSGQELLIAYPEIYAQIASNSTNLKFNVSTQCLDALGFASLDSTYNTATQMTSGTVTSGVVAAANSLYGPYYTAFKYEDSSGNVLAISDSSSSYYWVLNGAQIPQWNEYIVNGVQHTKDAFAKPSDLNSRNLLFYGNRKPDGTPDLNNEVICRENVPYYNTVIVHRLALDGPAWGSGSLLSGINCQGQSSTINLNQTNLNNSNVTLLFALTTAVLSVGMGQQISITY